MTLRAFTTTRRRWLLFLLVLPLWARGSYSLDPVTPVSQQVVRTWTADDGLPQGTVFGLAQSVDGYLWSASQEGLTRFDGAEFVVYDKRSSPAITNHSVICLLASRDGSVYAGTRGGGLVHLTSGQIVAYGTTDGLPDLSVSALYEGPDRTIWIGTQSGLARRLANGRIVVVARPDQLPHGTVTAIAEDSAGRIWIGTRGGIVTIENGRLLRHDADAFPKGHVMALSTARDGSMWIGTNGEGLYRHRGGHFREYTAQDGVPSRLVRAIYEDRHGVIWIGTLDHGVGRFINERFDFVTDFAGIARRPVSSVLEDREGNVWIGSTLGLTRVTDALVRSFTTAHGLMGAKVRTVHTDARGKLWIGTGGGLQTVDGERITKASGLVSTMVLSTCSDRDGALWVGTFDAGLQRVARGVTTVFDTKNGLRSNVVLSVHQDRSGAVWAGTALGLQKIVDGQVLPDVFDLSGQVVGVMLEDRDGALWIGTQDAGLNRLQDGKVVSFTTAHGLGSDFILALHQDSAGSLWVGTAGGGLSRFKDGRWSTITTREGLFDDNVFAILEDDRGNFWMSCNKGMFRAARRQLDDVADRRAAQVTSIAYGRLDGMASRECNGGTQPVACRTGDGRLWFATTNGVAMVDPSRSRATTLPPVMIQGMFADGRRLGERGTVALPAGTKRVEFHFAGLNFAAPEKLHYEYKLEGFDQDWVDAGPRRRATYTSLPGGKYTFRVRGAVDDGPWGTATATFDQREFIYRTPWFLSAVGLLLFASLALAHRLRIRLVRASAERFKLLFDRNPAGSLRATPSGGVLDCNDACAKMFGAVDRAALMTHGLAAIEWLETDWETIAARLREHGSLNNFEASVRSKLGTQAWLLMNANLVEDGQRHQVIEATIVDISQRKRQEQAARDTAYHDALTGLPNRELFKDRLSIALNYANRQGSRVAVICIDLDGFKRVNDAHGRPCGDEVLRNVAERLRSCLRQEDSVARVGDDEFSLLLLSPATVSDVTAVAHKVLQLVSAPMPIGGEEFNITSSMGVAFYPQDGADAESLLRNADSALYRAKESGGNGYQLCSPFLARKAADRLTVETALHQALEEREFVLYYQPQFELETQTMAGMEALIRWKRPGETIVRPAEFIGVAEDTRLIVPIGAWAIEEACRQGELWRRHGVEMRIAVNVSARQFQQPDIVSIIRQSLDRSGFDPRRLEIEITESTAMFNPDLTAEILLDLKKLGISIAIDDFGVGHSSLNYLKRFPIDALKIDQTFIRDVTRGGSDGAIISAVIALSKALNIRVIAEGVETEEQLKFLRDHGCHEAQGYLFCRPMPADALDEMIDTASPDAHTRRDARRSGVPLTEH